MFQGRLKTTLLGAGGLKDEDFNHAIREGKVDGVLSDLDPHLELEQPNMIHDNFVPYMYYRAGWSSAGAPPNYYNGWTGGGASWFAFVVLLNYTSEPTYTEAAGNEGYYDNFHLMAGRVTDDAGKRFVIDQIEAWQVWCEASGREQIFFRNRWLYLPSQAVSASINCLGIYFWEDLYTTYSRRKQRSGRIRFKDSGGNPITINKNSNQVLLLEYNWSLVSV